MNNVENPRHLILHLSLIDGIGPITIKSIFDRKLKNLSIDDFYNLNESDFQNIFNFSQKISNKLVNGLKDFKLFDDEIKLLEQNHNINFFTFLDDEYPFLLKNIYSPPAVLYVQGNSLEDSQKKIAIIGSRKADAYGQKIIDSIIPDLILNDWIIVSGGAIGADTMAHKSTIDCGGKTIVVFGSGLLKPYPFQNKKLFEKIVEKSGSLISSFPLNFEANPVNFPARNRIISGISKGCVVIQADLKSGTRITAQFALEQGKDVFAVPGSIENNLSSGCNKLIQEGAKLITCADDILIEYGEIKATNQTNVKQEILTELTIEGQIISICQYPMPAEEISDKLKLTLQETQNSLFQLQLEGKILQNFAGMWEKVGF